MPLSFTMSFHPLAVANSTSHLLEILQTHGAAMGLPNGAAPEEYRSRLDSIVTINHDRLEVLDPTYRSFLTKIISRNPADTIPLPLALPVIRIVADNLREGRWAFGKNEIKRERVRAAFDLITPLVAGHFDVLAGIQDPQVCQRACREVIEAMENAHYDAFDFAERRVRKEGFSYPSRLTDEDQLLATTGHLWLKRFQSLAEEIPMRVECAYFDGERFTDSFVMELIPEFRDGHFVIGKIITPFHRLEEDFGMEPGEPIPLDLRIKRVNP